MKKTIQKKLEQELTTEQSEYVIRSLKDISRNPSYADKRECHEYPTESQITAIDFDHIKTIYVNTLEQKHGKSLSYRSIDALYPTDAESWYFIEFKDGKVNSKVVDEVYEKINASKDILMDLEILEKGYLQVEDMKSVLKSPEAGEKDFLFNTRMKSLGYVNQIEYMRNHFYFILVYNKELLEETRQDGEAFRDEIKNGKYNEEISFLKSNQHLLKESANNLIERAIENGYFGRLLENIVKAQDYNSAEYKKLIRRFDEKIEERMELLERCKAVKDILGTVDDVNAMTGEDFVKALNVFAIYDNKVQKERKILSQIIDLEEHKYDLFIDKVKRAGSLIVPEGQDIDKYIRDLIYKDKFQDEYNSVMNKGKAYFNKLVDMLVGNSKVPKRLFYLYQFEGKYFKEVFTYSEEEFDKIFVKRFEKEEADR